MKRKHRKTLTKTFYYEFASVSVYAKNYVFMTIFLFGKQRQLLNVKN